MAHLLLRKTFDGHDEAEYGDVLRRDKEQHREEGDADPAEDERLGQRALWRGDEPVGEAVLEPAGTEREQVADEDRQAEGCPREEPGRPREQGHGPSDGWPREKEWCSSAGVAH